MVGFKLFCLESRPCNALKQTTFSEGSAVLGQYVGAQKVPLPMKQMATFAAGVSALAQQMPELMSEGRVHFVGPIHPVRLIGNPDSVEVGMLSLPGR